MLSLILFVHTTNVFFYTAVLEKLEVIPVKYPGQSFSMLSELAEEVMGGTSGALYSLMFVGASGHSNDWVATTQSAVRMMMTYSKARVGSRTMVTYKNELLYLT